MFTYTGSDVNVNVLHVDLLFKYGDDQHDAESKN